MWFVVGIIGKFSNPIIKSAIFRPNGACFWSESFLGVRASHPKFGIQASEADPKQP
jgi:hypothetical protein